MKVRIIPYSFFLLLDEVDVKILCSSVHASAGSLPSLTSLSKSAVYRRLTRLRKLGFRGEGVYIASISTDHNVQLLERPALVVTSRGCVYVPPSCNLNCPSCPLYGLHTRVFTELQICNCLWPRDVLRALVEKVLEKLGRGFEVEI